MKYEQVVEVLKEVKKEAKLGFARSAGNCCGSCTWAALPENKKGIWLKHYKSGMNRSPWRENEVHHIAHDLTNEQAVIVVNTLSKYFKVDYDFNDSHSIKISDKVIENGGEQ
jgi:hypothetical protein